MIEFWQALTESPMVRRAVLTAVLASVGCGIIGPYVVVRRITYIAGGIAHCVLGGLGAAVYLNRVWGWTWLDPLIGALVAALLAALLIGWVSLRAKQREDTVISALWALGMAIGVLFITATPGQATDLASYLFGTFAVSSPRETQLAIGLNVLLIAAGVLYYRKFLAVCFDEEFVRLRGVNVEFHYLLLLCLTALTVVVLVQVVGILMVIALLTLPVAIGGFFARQLWQLMIAAVVLSVLFVLAGQAISYPLDLPPGATTVVFAGAVYLLATGTGMVVRRGRG